MIVVDDIDANPAFRSFTKKHPEHPSFVCTAEPLSPDTRRFNQKGLFGLILKRTLCASEDEASASIRSRRKEY